MNTLFKLLILFCGSLSADIINAYPAAGQQTPNRNVQENGEVRDRKLVYSPYVLSESLAGKELGDENAGPEKFAPNPMLGPFQNAPLPAFGLGGMTPPSLGLTNMPYNYMYGSAMMHPMNPMNPMSNPGAMANQMNMGGMGNGFGDNPSGQGMDGSRELANWGALPRAQVRVGSYCQNVRKQAVEISNAIMKRQNRIIFKELMNYLLKSKYLIGMTEVKLTRVLRKKIYGLMSEYSNIDESNVQFIPVKENVVIQKQIVYQKAEDSASNVVSSSQQTDDRRKLSTKHGRK